VGIMMYLLPSWVMRTWYALNERLFLLQILPLHISLLIFTLTQVLLFYCSLSLVIFNSSLSSYSVHHSPRYICVLNLEWIQNDLERVKGYQK
jgi:hypothetical protein